MDHNSRCIDNGLQTALTSREQIGSEQVRVLLALEFRQLSTAVAELPTNSGQMRAHDLDYLASRVLGAKRRTLLARKPGIDGGQAS